MVKIAPSILSADFSKLGEELINVKNAGADLIHFDVMDGHFVPNISFGYKVLNDVKDLIDIDYDIHLMVYEPDYLIEPFYKAGATSITVHYEAVKDINNYIDIIKSYGMKAAVSIKPDTKVDEIKNILNKIDMVLVMSVYPGFGGQKFIESSLEKINELNNIRKENHYNYLIEVDGGINDKTCKNAVKNGADILVAGSYVFSSKDYKEAMDLLR